MNTKKLQACLDDYRQGYSLPQAFYTDEDVFCAECETIFKRDWLFAGSTAQIPKPGDYFLYSLRNDSIIIIRGNNGEVYAHHNTCRHRGSVICTKEQGHVAKLICPYHQWVYDKDGTLTNARMMPAHFCKEEYSLHRVHVQVAEGLIFISLAEEPPSFGAIRKSLSPFLKPYKIGEAKLACVKNHTLRANWKLVAENFRECYHCGGAHPEYCSAVVGANLRENTDELAAAKQKGWSNKGLPTELVEVVPGTTTYAIRYPLRPGVESYSVDGRKVSLPMGEHRDYDAGVVGLVNYPNFWMDAVSDYVWTMRVTPVNASTTDVQFCWLVDKNAVEGKDYTTEHLTEFWDITGEQDGRLCENNFRGIESSAYRPGPYAPVEDQVVNFVDWCVERLREGVK
jgi:phenylpropionate dioxygenase-like ring-hydroxylating dioxygenase large terminal subunit